MASIRVTDRPADVNLSGGVAVKNNGPYIVYYRDETPVSASQNDGSIAVGDSISLTGTQWFATTSGSVSYINVPPPTPAAGASTAAAVDEATVRRLTRPLMSIASRGAIYKNGFETVDTIGITTRHRMVVKGVTRAGGLVLRYGHWGWGGGTTPTGSVIIDAYLEMPNGKLIRVTFKGKQSFTLEPRGVVDSDPIGVNVTAGSIVYARTFIRATAATVDMPAHWSADTGTFSWKLAGNQLTAANPTAPTGYDGTGFTANSIFYYSPVELLARYVDATDSECFALIGDSNMDATGTTDDFATLALNSEFAYARLCTAGASVTAWSQPGANAHSATASVDPTPLFALVEGCTFAVIALGTNDFGTSQTAAQIVDLLDQMAVSLKLRGIEKVVACTMPPRTSSTTSTSLPVDEVLQPDATLRSQSNALLRLGTANIDWISDNASAVEVDDNGVYMVTGNKWATGSTSDGTHYRSAGHTAVQPVLRNAIDSVLAGGRGGISQSVLLQAPANTPPVNTAAPVVTGTPTTGQTLSCSTGSWSGYPTPTYAYQWKRNGANIGGATASTYVLQVADEGTSVKCTVTATNSSGAVSADSNTVTPSAPASGPSIATIGAAGSTGATDSVNVAIPYPTGVQTGDLLVIFIGSRGTTSINTGAGINDRWKPATLHQVRSANGQLEILTRIADATDVSNSSGATPVTIVMNNSANHLGRMLRITGANATTFVDDVDGFDTGANSTTAQTPASTTTVTNTLILRATTAAYSGASYSNTWPTSTEQTDDNNANGGVALGLTIASKNQAASGSTGTEDVTQSQSLRAATATLAIKS